MAENQSQASGSFEEPGDPNVRPQGDGAQNPPPERKKRRRRWPWIVGGFVLFLVLVLVLAPTLLSIGPARSMVLGVVNNSLNGRVEVADWSLGWNGGITVNGLKVYEDKGGKDLILQASRVRTELSLLKALRSGFTELALGRTDVDNLDLVNLYVDENGTPNIAKVAKAEAAERQPKEGGHAGGGGGGAKAASKPVHLSGDIHVNNMTGRVSAAGISQKLRINPSDLSVAMTGLNDPIENDVKLAFVVEDPANPQGTPGTITLKGKADLFDQDRFDLDKADVQEKLNLADVNVAAVNPFLAIAKLDLALAGVAAGAVDVNLKGTSNAGAVGEIKVANFRASGAALKGDTFTSNLAVPVKITRVVDPGRGAVLKVDDLRIVTDYGSVAVTGDAPEEAIQNLQKKQPPGREGHLTVTADFDRAAKLLESLRNTLQLQPDVKLESAKVFAQVDAWLFADRVVNKTQFKLSDVAATNKAERVKLEPVTSTVDVTYVPMGNVPFTIAQVKDVGVTLASAFAKVDGATPKGGTLGQFQLTAESNLDKLRQQLAQFVDLGKLDLRGTCNLALKTNGDPTKEDAVVNTNVKFTAKDLVVAGLGDYAPIRQPWMDLTAAGNVRLKANKPESITEGAVVLKSNNPDNPTVYVQAKGDVDLNTLASKRFDLSVKAMLAKARDEFGPVAPALNYLESGQLAMSASGSYDGKNLTLLTDQPLALKVSNLSVRQEAGAKAPVAVRDQSLDLVLAGVISMAGEQLGADVKTLSVTAPKLLEVKKNDGDLKVMKVGQKLTGNGGIKIAYADLKRLSDMAKSFGPPTTQPSGPDANVGQLTRALLSGTLAFRRGEQPVTAVDGKFTADVGMTTAKEPINDKIAIMLNATAPDELTQPLKASLVVQGDNLKAAVTDAVVVLARQLADQTTAFNGPFDLLRSAKVSVTAERLEMLQAMVDSFSPPAPAVAPRVAPQAPVRAAPARRVSGEERISGDERISRPEVEAASAEGAAEQPLPPLKVLSGRMVLNANVSREGQTTSLKDTTLAVSNFSFRRGDGFYESKDRKMDLKLAAAVETAEPPAKADAKSAPRATASIKRIQVQELGGDLDVGQLKLAKPIVITNLTAAIPSVDGAVQLTGRLGEALRMLEAFQGAKAGTKYPYSGDYDLTQNVTTEGDTLHLAGSVKATKFKAYDPAKPNSVTFSEDLLTVANDVSADTKTSTATIKNFAVNMESTGALKLAVSDGQLQDWAEQRKITKELRAKLHVDWPRLWTIVRPMLDPETQDSLKDLQLAGVMDKQFLVSGSYPVHGVDRRGNRIVLNTAQALKSLNAYGGVSFDEVSVNGIDVRNLDLPVSLEGGVLYVQDATKPKGQRYPQPFACNGGQIDLGGLQVNLTHTGADGAIVPWFTIPDKNKVVLKNVAMNPILADTTIGNYVNPGFSGPKDARGRVTLTSVECRDVPLDWFTAAKKQTTPGGPDTQNPSRRVRQQSRSDGRAEFLLAISEMELQAPILPLLLRTDRLSGEVKKGHIVIENGIVKSDIPIVDPKGDALITWNGSVNLQDRHIVNFNTAIAKDLLADLPLVRNNQKFLPAFVNVPISGPFDKPKIDLLGAVTKSALPGFGSGKPEDVIQQLPDLLGGKKDKKDKSKSRGDEPRSSTDDGRDTGGTSRGDNAARGGQQPEDPVGGLLDIAGGLLNKDKKKSGKGSDGGSGGSRDYQDSRGGRDPRGDAGPSRDMGEDRISGDERISGGPRSTDDARPAGARRDIGDERISSGARRPATRPSDRNVQDDRNER